MTRNDPPLPPQYYPLYRLMFISYVVTDDESAAGLSVQEPNDCRKRISSYLETRRLSKLCNR
jgi:hypothetical protein